MNRKALTSWVQAWVEEELVAMPLLRTAKREEADHHFAGRFSEENYFNVFFHMKVVGKTRTTCACIHTEIILGLHGLRAEH